MHSNSRLRLELPSLAPCLIALIRLQINDAEAAWEAEVAKRIRDLDGQAVTPIPWSEARRTIVGGE